LRFFILRTVTENNDSPLLYLFLYLQRIVTYFLRRTLFYLALSFYSFYQFVDGDTVSA